MQKLISSLIPSRLAAVAIGIVGLACLIGASPSQHAVTLVPDIAALRELGTFSAESGIVTRVTDGVAGSPRLDFTPGSRPCDTDDGANCVNSADGKSWHAVWAGDPDIRHWGATQSADIMPYLKAAWLAQTGKCIYIPAGIWRIESAQTFTINGAGSPLMAAPCFRGDKWGFHVDGGGKFLARTGTWLYWPVDYKAITPFTIRGTCAADCFGGNIFYGSDVNIEDISFVEDQPAPSSLVTKGVFTGSISGNTLTVTSISSGSLNNGASVSGAGVPEGTLIAGQQSGSAGGIGTYIVHHRHPEGSTVGSTVITARNWEPNDYHYLFKLSSFYSFAFHNVHFHNLTQCVDFNIVGRLRFDNVTGQPLGTCINMQRAYDIPVWGLVDFWPFWNDSTPVTQYMYWNVDPIITTSGFYVDGTLFDIGYHSGLRLHCNVDCPVEGFINSFYPDQSMFGLWVDLTVHHASWTFNSFYNNTGFSPAGWTASSTIEDDGTSNRITIGNWILDATGGSAYVDSGLRGGGHGNTLDVGKFAFSPGGGQRWNKHNSGAGLFRIANETHTPGVIRISQMDLQGATGGGGPLVEDYHYNKSNGVYEINGLQIPFRPTLNFLGGNGWSYGSQSGTYEHTTDGLLKVGFNLSLTSLGSAAGTVTFNSPIPCAVQSTSPGSVGQVSYATNFRGLTSNIMMSSGTGGSTVVDLYELAPTGVQTLSAGNFTPRSQMIGMYQCFSP